MWWCVVYLIYPIQIRFADSNRNQSFCRNPSGERYRPWCYSDNPDPEVDWEFCDVPLCGKWIRIHTFDNIWYYAWNTRCF